MSKPKNKLAPKLTFSFLGLIGIATLVLGFISLTQVIRYPNQQSTLARSQAISQRQAIELGSQLYLQQQDTDQDLLSDYDELNIYGTSPYLADSDSDGFSDKEEIDSGNDPNCPVGQNCRTDRIDQPDIQDPLIDDFGLGQFSDLLEVQDIGPADPAAETVDLSKLTPDQIRQLLVESGDISQDQIEQIDDATLIQIYSEVLGEIIAYLYQELVF